MSEAGSNGSAARELPAEPSNELGDTVDLLRAAQAGSQSALESLLARYSDRVLEIVRIRLGRSLREALESRDLLQETMIEAFRSIERFQWQSNPRFLAWLAGIAEHRILQHATRLQAAKRNPARNVSWDELDPSDREGVEAVVTSPQKGVLTRLVEQDERDSVADCVAELPQPYRRVIELHDYVGLGWEEVASELGLETPNAARMTHNRARVALGNLLRRRGFS